MEDLFAVAFYIARWHKQLYGTVISEMKLHKLLYFTQRESYIHQQRPLFESDFQAWQYGPVLCAIRSAYPDICNETLPNILPLSTEGQIIINQALKEYGRKDAWSLSRLSHGECSWKKARGRLLDTARCNRTLNKVDIAEDANRVRTRRALFAKG